ncbi:SAF domain-containing protein [Paenibacillus periandrae]|uniref:SAF domain-containing protein n=1 Tax=Paenibacillus periandrae TaxID=1761741 RepID=UPI001F09EF0C|nr:SAF domain-containing protein [Paenibacillus periandrae]
MIIVSLALAMWWWEVDGRQRAFYVDVPVFKNDIKRGELIKDDMFTTVKYEKDQLIDNYIKEQKKIIGLEAKQFIPKNIQLDVHFFESPDLLTDEKHMNWKIPNEWIYSIPNSLRRKDQIVFYEIDAESMNIKDKDKKIQIDATSKVSEDTEKRQVLITQIQDEKNKLQGRNVSIYTAVVSYVKDSANREVVSTSPVDRIDANSTIKDLEIIATKEDMDLLSAIVSKGSKFIIGYNDGGSAINESKNSK